METKGLVEKTTDPSSLSHCVECAKTACDKCACGHSWKSHRFPTKQQPSELTVSDGSRVTQSETLQRDSEKPKDSREQETPLLVTTLQTQPLSPSPSSPTLPVSPSPPSTPRSGMEEERHSEPVYTPGTQAPSHRVGTGSIEYDSPSKIVDMDDGESVTGKRYSEGTKMFDIKEESSKDEKARRKDKRRRAHTGGESTKQLGRKLGRQLDLLSSIEEARTLQEQMKVEQELKKDIIGKKIDLNQKVIHLPRGGFYVNTKAGPIQFGLPPETIKDSMALGLTLPNIYVLPKQRFNLKMGINVGEFEFPSYYTFFFKKKQINLVIEPEVEPLIRTIFTETLLGPREVELPQRFSKDVPKEAYPDLMKEMSFFRVNPFDKKELTVDSILQFTHFNEGCAKIGTEVEIHDEGNEYVIYQDDKEYARVSCHVFISPPLQEVKEEKKDSHFVPPYFGVTMLGNSDGFDVHGTTTGFVLWMNRRGIMVDPPPHSGTILKKHGIHPRLIRGVILTHCHADHDAGTFQKILEEGRVVLLTTEVIMNSFLRKYSAISGLEIDFLRKLFVFRPVIVGEKTSVYGGFLKFFYSLHSIPCVGFVAYSAGKSMVYSGDSFNDAEGIQKFFEKGLMTTERRDKLLNFPWHHDLILHEAGVPPIHTPLKTLEALSTEIKARLYVVHKPSADVPESKGLKSAKVGPENTIVISNERGAHFHAMEILDLLGSIEVFSNLVVSRGVEILGCARRRRFSKGQTLITEGTEGDEMYIIAMGVVSIVVKEKIVKYLHVGDHFGEMSLITGEARTASVCAESEIEVLTISKADFMHIVRWTDAVERLKQLGAMQKSKSWQCMMKNTLLSELTSSQKTYLQSILRTRTTRKGEEVWVADSPATEAVLIEEGEYVFAGASETKPFTRGAFVGDMFALLNNETLSTTLICTEAGSIYYVPKEDLRKFFDDYPGFRLFFLDRNFVE